MSLVTRDLVYTYSETSAQIFTMPIFAGVRHFPPSNKLNLEREDAMVSGELRLQYGIINPLNLHPAYEFHTVLSQRAP